MSDYKDFDLGSLESSATGLDAFFAPEPKTARTKVASLEQLSGFVRTGSDTLVHKSQKDLWSLQKDAKGDFYIERLFDSSGDPVKG